MDRVHWLISLLLREFHGDIYRKICDLTVAGLEITMPTRLSHTTKQQRCTRTRRGDCAEYENQMLGYSSSNFAPLFFELRICELIGFAHTHKSAIVGIHRVQESIPVRYTQELDSPCF
jgi:hypothetical protein